MRPAAVLIGALLALSAMPVSVSTEQQPVARDGSAAVLRLVSGQVRSDDDSAALLRRVKVTVAGSNAAPVYTDQEGRFEIAVPARAYTLRITKPGFAPQAIQRTAAADTTPIAVRLARGAAINGRVLDSLGTPMVDARVNIRTVRDAAARNAVTVNTVVLTDDLGEFRVGSLAAGRYELLVENSPVEIAMDAATAANATRSIGPAASPAARPALAAPPSSGALAGSTSATADGVTPSAEARTPQENATSTRVTPVQLRVGDEADLTLVHDRRGAEYQAATSYAAGYEAGLQAARFTVAGRFVRGTATLSGRVTDHNGRGVVGAIVRLNPVSPGTPRMAASDPTGRYVFTALNAGSYRVFASKTGLLDAEHGQERTGQPGAVVSLRDKQRLDRIDVGLRRGAAISGLITDPDGEPIEGLAMHVWRLEYRSGRPVTETVARVRRTDDRGRYRVHSLQPGSYYVVASDDPTPTDTIASVMRAPRAFYPGADTLPLATPVVVDATTDATGIDMAFAPARTVRVSGRAMDSTNGAPLNRPVALYGSTRSGLPAPAVQMAAMNGYNFEFPNVGPGEYVIQALQYWGDRPEFDLPTEFTTQLITVGEQDIAGVMLITNPGSTVTGRVRLQSGGRPAVTGNWLNVAAADPDFEPASTLPRPWQVFINPDLTFRITGLTGPIRFISTPDLSPTLWLKAADMGGLNLADEPAIFARRDDSNLQIDVVLAADGAEISGRVVDGRKESVASYVVVAFPVAGELRYNGSRYIKLARPDDQAQFKLGMLPPGDYWIAAVDALEDSAVQNPALLDVLEGSGRRVTLTANQRMTTDLPLIRLRR